MAIAAGKPACIRLGIEIIDDGQVFFFGRTLKSDTARALRPAPLSKARGRRVWNRVLEMLQREYIPREYYDYARQARKIGFDVDDLPLNSADASVPGGPIRMW